MAKLLFKKDGKVNGEVVFKAGQIYEISNEKGSVDRWLKRGAELVKESPVVAPIQEEAKEEVQAEEAIANPEAKVNNKGRKSKSAKA